MRVGFINRTRLTQYNSEDTRCIAIYRISIHVFACELCSSLYVYVVPRDLASRPLRSVLYYDSQVSHRIPVRDD